MPPCLVSAPVCQVAARAKALSLDQIRLHTECTDLLDLSAVKSQPEDGVYVHGLHLENARWDPQAHTITDAQPPELHSLMPVLHLIGRPVGAAPSSQAAAHSTYACPVYTTTLRGPTFVFEASLVSSVHVSKWVLAGAALVMQPEH